MRATLHRASEVAGQTPREVSISRVVKACLEPWREKSCGPWLNNENGQSRGPTGLRYRASILPSWQVNAGGSSSPCHTSLCVHHLGSIAPTPLPKTNKRPCQGATPILWMRSRSSCVASVAQGQLLYSTVATPLLSVGILKLDSTNAMIMHEKGSQRHAIFPRRRGTIPRCLGSSATFSSLKPHWILAHRHDACHLALSSPRPRRPNQTTMSVVWYGKLLWPDLFTIRKM